MLISKKLPANRAVHNFFHLGGGAMSLAEVENMAAMQSFTLGGFRVHAPPGDFGHFRCILVHSEVYRDTQSFSRRGSSS